MDEQVERWLKEHSHELPPEEIISEEEKFSTPGSWPIPKKVSNMGIFYDINSQNKFNNIIGDPKNWSTIRMRSDLYKQWIVPHAIILFGKLWFDRVKWKNSIQKGIPFPLFSDEEKKIANKDGKKLEETTCGRATIMKIINKVDYALGVYLEGKWFKDTNQVKKPGGYIIDSLKNEFIREIGNDLGYKLKSVSACPYCLSNKISQKTPLVYHGSFQYSCPRCAEYYENLKCANDNTKDPEILEEIRSVKIFRKFIGITCVCPSNECKGKFVPIGSIDFKNWKVSFPKSKLISLGKVIKDISVSKNTQGFLKPPPEIADLPLICPFCHTKFSPRTAIELGSGFKNKSGFLTGLPTISIWEKKCSSLDKNKGEFEEFSKKNNIVCNFFGLDEKILAKQNINILINEMVRQISKLNTNLISGLTSWCFYVASIEWMIKYWQDAYKYFFNWSVRERDMTEKEMIIYPGKNKKKMTDVIRGQSASIHQSLFYIWMNIIEKNINHFKSLNSKINNIEDFKWFCRPPKFSGGPISIFLSKVNFNMKVANNSEIVNLDSNRFSPRIAGVKSIYKVLNDKVLYEYNFKNDIKFCEWQSIQLKKCGLKPNDIVQVEAIMMPGHTTHAPIQRIIRLRTKNLGPIIEKIKKEERSGKRNLRFWESWNKSVSKAKEITGINVELKE